MQSSVGRNANFKVRELACTDGSTVKSARFTDFDFQARKKLRVVKESDLVGDCHIYSSLTVDGPIIATSLDLSTAGQAYIDNIAETMYHLLGWDNTLLKYKFSLLGYDDSVDGRILDLKNNTYTKIEVDVKLSNAYSNAISYYLQSTYTSTPTGNLLTTPCSVIPLGNSFVIPFSSNPSSKSRFLFQGNTPTVGKVLTCISLDGETEWRDVSTSPSVVTSIDTSNGLSTTSSFTVNDTVTHQGFDFLPAVPRATKNTIVAENDSVLSGHFINRQTTRAICYTVDCVNSVGMRLQCVDLTGYSVLELFGGENVTRNSSQLLSATQVIRMDHYGIHIESINPIQFHGEIKVLKKEANYYNADSTVVPASLEIGTSLDPGTLRCYGDATLLSNLLLPQGAASGKVWSCTGSSGAGHWVSPPESTFTVPNAFDELVTFNKGIVCNVHASSPTATFNIPIHSNSLLYCANDYLRIHGGNLSQYTTMRDDVDGVVFDIRKGFSNNEKGFFFETQGNVIMSLYQNVLTIPQLMVGSGDIKSVSTTNQKIPNSYENRVVMTKVTNPLTRYSINYDSFFNYHDQTFIKNYTTDLSPVVASFNFSENTASGLEYYFPIRWRIVYRYMAGMTNNRGDTFFVYSTKFATIHIVRQSTQLIVESFTVTLNTQLKEYRQHKNHGSPGVGENLKFLHFFADSPISFSYSPNSSLPFGIYEIRIDVTLEVRNQGDPVAFVDYNKDLTTITYDPNDYPISNLESGTVISSIVCLIGTQSLSGWSYPYNIYPNGLKYYYFNEEAGQYFPITPSTPYNYYYPIPTPDSIQFSWKSNIYSYPPPEDKYTFIKSLGSNIFLCKGPIQCMGIGTRAGTNQTRIPNFVPLFNADWSDTTNRLRLFIDNQVITTIAPNSSVCDYRLKENILPAGPILDRLASIPMIEYSIKETDTTKKDGNRLGCLAHILQETFPEFPNLVNYEKDSPDHFQSINSPDLVLLLLKGLQEERKERKKDFYYLFMFYFGVLVVFLYFFFILRQ